MQSRGIDSSGAAIPGPIIAEFQLYGFFLLLFEGLPTTEYIMVWFGHFQSLIRANTGLNMSLTAEKGVRGRMSKNPHLSQKSASRPMLWPAFDLKRDRK